MPRDSQKKLLIDAMCLKHAMGLMAADSSEEEDDEMASFNITMLSLLSHRRCILREVEPTVPRTYGAAKLDDEQFYRLVGVDQRQFSHILSLIKDDFTFRWKCSPRFSAALQLRIVLYRLCRCSDDAKVRNLSKLFGMGDGGSAQNFTKRVFKAILQLKDKYLAWPDENERRRMLENTREQLPGCIGYIGSTLVKLAVPPPYQQTQYYAQNGSYGVELQVVCDHRLLIRRITLDCPQCTHSKVDVYNIREADFSEGQCVIGCNDYPTRPYLVTPSSMSSRDCGKELSEIFRAHVSKNLVRVENCFELLANRFGSLKALRQKIMGEKGRKECDDWITVCCILHNILIQFDSADS